MADRAAQAGMDLITLPHHAEFLSDRWLDEARRFWRELPPTRRAPLAGRAFSVSERFADAPPHLKLPGDVASWTLRFDGKDCAIARGFDPDADLAIEGDYQAALFLAQFVGVAAPGGAEEMWREAAALFGKDAFRVRGALTEEAAQRALASFHDHMARRTVENPDLEHRARRLGLTGKIREMEENGFVVIERAISTDFADELRAATRAAMAPDQVLLDSWLYLGRPFERVILNPMLMTLIDASLGRCAQIATLGALLRGPGPGQIDIHTDYTDVPEPYPEYALSGVAVWSLEDWTVASGPTWIVPKSHRHRRAPRPGEGLEDGVPIEMPKGSAVFFTQGVWHWQGPRTEPGERVTLHPHFNRNFLRSIDPKRPDVSLLARNPPRLGEMLGLDDGFDKLTSAGGRDYLRLEHTRQLHAFTRRKLKEILRAPEAAAA
ncbi:MAG TPA: phytanoyl-CoA dioxygenase family protein [Caulobacteraceae bacterium]|nr:phytanoyl-CoA dioxygenase family protein [Caulobacteraceae bacterium]